MLHSVLEMWNETEEWLSSGINLTVHIQFRGIKLKSKHSFKAVYKIRLFTEILVQIFTFLTAFLCTEQMHADDYWTVFATIKTQVYSRSYFVAISYKTTPFTVVHFFLRQKKEDDVELVKLKRYVI